MNDLKLTNYDNFLKLYVTDPPYDYTISFKYNEKYYQFDYIGAEKNTDGTNSYNFYSYEREWESVIRIQHFSSLVDAINSVRIDNKTFRDVFESSTFEIIDIS